MERFTVLVKWFFSPSTFRGFIIAITATFGYVLPDDKMATVVGIGALILAGWEMFMKQYDTEEQNAEVE